MNKKLKGIVAFQIILIVLSLALVGVLAFQIAPMIVKKNDLEKEIKELNKSRDSITINLNEIIVLPLQAFGWNPSELEGLNFSDEIVMESVKADNELKYFYFDGDPRENFEISVDYYTKIKEQKRIDTALTSLGFEVIDRVSNPNNKNQNSNSIMYSDQVPLADVKLVAYTLIRTGARIREIAKDTLSGGLNGIIQVQFNPGIENEKAYSIDSIKKVESLEIFTFKKEN